MVLLFRSDQQNFLDLGFGAVLNTEGGGQIAEMSTQAVLELIRNVSDQECSSHVEISGTDVENFCLPYQGEVFLML